MKSLRLECIYVENWSGVAFVTVSNTYILLIIVDILTELMKFFLESNQYDAVIVGSVIKRWPWHGLESVSCIFKEFKIDRDVRALTTLVCKQEVMFILLSSFGVKSLGQ